MTNGRYYFLQKLSMVNYKIATHEGDANRRLASQAVVILYKLFPSNVPDKYKKGFGELLKLIEDTLNDIPEAGLHPVRIKGIRNSTAVRFIKLLIELEDCLESETKNEHNKT